MRASPKASPIFVLGSLRKIARGGSLVETLGIRAGFVLRFLGRLSLSLKVLFRECSNGYEKAGVEIHV